MRALATGMLALLALVAVPALSTVGLAQGAAPTMSVNKSALVFAATTSGSAFAAQTSQQVVRLTKSGAGAVTWTVASTQPWLTVSPAAGSGTANVRIGVTAAAGLPPSGAATGSVVITYTGSATASSTVGVTLRLQPAGTSVPPFGSVDTPMQNAIGVTGAVPFTGWALDDIEVARVGVCRAAFGAEVAAVDARCGSQAQIYVGDAVFIDGARGDVQVGYATYPRNSQAGWGFMVLTNMLPAQGNGPYTFYIWAQDVEGQSALLDTRAMTCDNEHAKLPFGTIDTPGQGETISGNAYANFGWALTQNPKYIPIDFPALMVYIDGAAIGPPSYGHYRSDIATIFPGLANSNGAVGYKIIDTTPLTDGLHTIVWTATDNQGFTEGLGSRFFTVANGAAVTRRTEALRNAETSPVLTAAAVDAAPVPATASTLIGRRGWAADAPWRTYPADAAGVIRVHGEEIDRFELQLGLVGADRLTGYLRVGAALASLPVGSTLDATTGRFTWSPGVGFIGAYDLVFVRTRDGQAVGRQDVQVVIRAKSLAPQVVIDSPRSEASVDQPFTIDGWAADLTGQEGSGIDTLHVWAYPSSGAAPVFLGVANSGLTRADVAAAYGDEFSASGYQLTVQGLSAGDYDVAVFAWSRRHAGFLPASVVHVHVR